MSMYLTQSFIYKTLRVLYNHSVYANAGIHGRSLPPWDWRRQRIGPLPVLPVMDAIRKDMQQRPAGTAFFAHLLIPHKPFIYGADCNPLPVELWGGASDAVTVLSTASARKSRAELYQLYFKQLKCLYKVLATMFDDIGATDMWQGATIIVHGDHGSKIGLSHGVASNQPDDDLEGDVDGHSTLFAVKAAGLKPGYDLQPAPIHELFHEFWRGHLRELSAPLLTLGRDVDAGATPVCGI